MFGFWFWFAMTYLAIGVAFILLMIGAHKAEQEMRREQCMMNHPAGTRRMTEQSPTGQASKTFNPHQHLGATYGKLAREIAKGETPLS